MNRMSDTMSTQRGGARAAMSVYAGVVYLAFLVVFLYVIGFVEGLVVPKDIDDGRRATTWLAVAVDVGLLLLFAGQHSIMARATFKRWWTRIIPEPIERSTYVAFATGALALLMWQWRPLPTVIWDLDATAARVVVYAISFAGWGIVLLSTFLIDHFDLFGLRQVYRHHTGRPADTPQFQTPLLYRLVRHPLYLGFLLAFWAAPTMTVGHLLFAAGTTAYILLAIQLEERDLVGHFGDDYRDYRRRTPMLVPRPQSGS